MRRLSVLLLVGACAAKPAPEPRWSNPGAKYAASPRASTPAGNRKVHVNWTVEPPKPATAVPLVPRPVLDFATFTVDFHDELRWPLGVMDHPSLEPRFAIADALAEPGVGWTDLCKRGAQNRHGIDLDLQAYLRGWCSALDGDADAAVGRLGPLLHSATSRIGVAVKTDIANILASGHAEDAERAINRHHTTDTELLDLLAASFVELGRIDDAREINRLAVETDDRATAATRCTRLAREVVLAGDRSTILLDDIHALGRAPHGRSLVGDEACVKLDHKLRCWASSKCEAFLADLGASSTTVDTLHEAYDLWLRATQSADWRDIANRAKYAIPAPGATELALAAMENEILTGGCTFNIIQWLRHSRPQLERGIGISLDLASRYAELKELCH